MPEGDTIHRVVGRLRPILEGERVTRLSVSRITGPTPSVGEIVDDVRAVGKHLVISFSGGLSIRVHLRMTGSWHAYEPGQRWTKAASSARVVIGTADWVVVCFNAPDVSVGPDPDAERLRRPLPVPPVSLEGRHDRLTLDVRQRQLAIA